MKAQVQQQAPGERSAQEAAAEADEMGVEHLLCLSSWQALGELLDVVDETCMRCYAAARAAGKQYTRTHARTHTHTHTHKLLASVDETCMRCYAAARAAGKQH